MRILVTGGLGFIGCYTISALSKLGHRVFVVDNLSRSKMWCERYIRDRGLDVALLRRDILDLERGDLPSGLDAVVHLAALINVDESIEKPDLYYRINALGTVRLYSLCSGMCGRFIFISSASVYGDPVKIPIDEDHPYNPINPYGASKVSAEVGIRSMYRSGCGLDYMILRLFNVYGAGQSIEYAGVIARFAERLSRGEPPVIYGDGLQVRDFIHVVDVVRAIARAVDAEDGLNETYNIASGRGVRIRDLAYMMIGLSGLEIDPIYMDAKPGDVRVSVASIAKATNVLGWSPIMDFRSGIMEVLNYHRYRDDEQIFRSLDDIPRYI